MSKNKKSFDLSKYSGLLASLISIVCGLMIAFVILMLTNPSKGASAFMTILGGGFKFAGPKNVGTLLYFATPILCTGAAMCLAFQAGVFNIGGPGQYTIGAFCAIVTAIYASAKLPAPLTWLLPVLAGMLGGALWSLIPGILKAYFNVNIVISTVMFNYIEQYYILHWISLTCYDAMKGQTQAVPAQTKLPQWIMPTLTNNKASDIGILVAVIAAVIVWIILDKTKLGYELKACGKNAEASRYAGIQSKKIIVISIVLSGALCGLGGALTHLSWSGTYITFKLGSAAEGFTGIAVACLANNNPLAAIFGALFLAYLTVGGNYMQIFGFQKEIVNIITSIIIYFSAFSLFLRQWIERAILRGNKKEINKVTGEELK